MSSTTEIHERIAFDNENHFTVMFKYINTYFYVTNVVSRVSLLTSYMADKINPFKLGAVLQKHGDHKTSDGYI